VSPGSAATGRTENNVRRLPIREASQDVDLYWEMSQFPETTKRFRLYSNVRLGLQVRGSYCLWSGWFRGFPSDHPTPSTVSTPGRFNNPIPPMWVVSRVFPTVPGTDARDVRPRPRIGHARPRIRAATPTETVPETAFHGPHTGPGMGHSNGWCASGGSMSISLTNIDDNDILILM